eukprot:CAMPEP_0185040684 /NCGR_PEP_ID=MMETSP1103-20130426/39012_1 /TAXON_ID=36769 /ORGANISM="Paraphysomonas bandaiensis, Strain Caron Lab Isolate" /LENGTH=844 /DNA_ID=CAMNT_0027580075 /DNA_START=797 /DNA_END=3331 /DNA_ORIENTATION=+
MNWASMQRVKLHDELTIYPVLSIEQHPSSFIDLDDSETTNSGCVSKQYELVSILMHSGSAHAGHYFCYIKDKTANDANERWLLFNDSTVSALSTEQLGIILGSSNQSTSLGSTMQDGHPTLASSTNAYMLVYRDISRTNHECVSYDRTCVGAVPSDLRHDIETENTVYIEQKAKYEYEKAFLHISVSPVLVGTVEIKTVKQQPYRVLRIHESSTLEQLTDMVYENFTSGNETMEPLLDGRFVRRGDIRLRAFDAMKGSLCPPSVLFSLDRNLVPADTISQKVKESNTVLSMLSDDILRRVMYVEIKPHSADSWVEDGGLSISLEVVVYQPESDSGNAFLPPVSFNVAASSTLSDLLMRAYESAFTAGILSEPPEMVNTSHITLVKQDILTGDVKRIEPRSINGVEPLAANMVSVGDRVYLEYTGRLNSTTRVGLLDYFDSLSNLITISYTDLNNCTETENIIRKDLSVDKRCPLYEVKRKISASLNLSLGDFKIIRGSEGDTLEVKNMSLSLVEGGYDDGSYMQLALGVPLSPGEYRVKVILNHRGRGVHARGSCSIEESYLDVCETTVKMEQSVKMFKDWLTENYGHVLYQEVNSSNNAYIRLQLAVKHSYTDRAQVTQPVYKTTTVLSDEKSLYQCLGSQLKDGVCFAVTLNVAESSYSDSTDMLVSLWQWLPSEGIVKSYGDVVVGKECSFKDIKVYISSFIGGSTAIARDESIYFAKPFTWQLKSPATNIPYLKWGNQPIDDTCLLTGPPLRLACTNTSGPALLLFKICHRRDLTEVDENIDCADSSGQRQEEIGFRIYTPDQQEMRHLDEMRTNSERKDAIETQLKAIQSRLTKTNLQT